MCLCNCYNLSQNLCWKCEREHYVDHRRELLKYTNVQAKDEGLWAEPQTGMEAILQTALRELTRAVEKLLPHEIQALREEYQNELDIQ